MRNVFFSFHFQNDFWRTQQVRQMGNLLGQPLCRPNEWEEVKRKGDASIERWIDESLERKTCVIVLVGSETSERKWVRREIEKGWNAGKGVLGIRIHQLLDQNSTASAAGANPFESFTFGAQKRNLASIVPLVSPPGQDSKQVYGSIRDGIEDWIERAIAIRAGAR